MVLALVAGGAVLVLHRRSARAPRPTSPGTTAGPAATTTTRALPPNAPLTGLPDPGGVAQRRSALTIKIENTPEALPQFGIDQADVVYEEIVNGGITRLAAVFNSRAPTKVGPVRSVRPTDQQVVWPLGGIFAFSGGAPYAIASIQQAPVKLLQESNAGSAMFRDYARQAPHNLYASAPGLFAFGGVPTPPRPLFAYRSNVAAVAGPRVANFVVPFPSIYSVTWTWNTATLAWDRSIFGQPLVTGTGVRVAPQNVIVMWVNYVNGVGTFSSYANLQGSGSAAVFTDGREIRGTWSRAASKADPLTYYTTAGATIALTPGQTWVELVNEGTNLNVTP